MKEKCEHFYAENFNLEPLSVRRHSCIWCTAPAIGTPINVRERNIVLSSAWLKELKN